MYTQNHFIYFQRRDGANINFWQNNSEFMDERNIIIFWKIYSTVSILLRKIKNSISNFELQRVFFYK